ncbi:hypothetical protein EVAR_11200_1 [Eumeta japonica]|uniref:Uncharacterized protein n=1 Tax=Eumeta variegata TaxID=151549 RepID=A0A4C1U4E9_EUMVA|nr:hypothetical protein EVAR_11200_1 [Eumeta japonica]
MDRWQRSTYSLSRVDLLPISSQAHCLPEGSGTLSFALSPGARAAPHPPASGRGARGRAAVGWICFYANSKGGSRVERIIKLSISHAIMKPEKTKKNFSEFRRRTRRSPVIVFGIRGDSSRQVPHV